MKGMLGSSLGLLSFSYCLYVINNRMKGVGVRGQVIVMFHLICIELC
jgi:hypothetical protein